MVLYNHARPKRGLIQRDIESSVIRPLLYLQAATAGFGNFFNDFEDTLQNINLTQMVNFPTWSRIVNEVLKETTLDHIKWLENALWHKAGNGVLAPFVVLVLTIVSWICHGMILAFGSVVLIGDWLGLAS